MNKKNTLTKEERRIREGLFWRKVGITGNIVVSTIFLVTSITLAVLLYNQFKETAYLYRLMHPEMMTIKIAALVVIIVAIWIGIILASAWVGSRSLGRLIKFHLDHEEE